MYEILRPIFEYVPGDRSPPPAPKHATAASSKPRVQRAPAPPRRQAAYQAAPDYDAMDTSVREDETPENGSVISDSYADFETQLTNSRKRRRIEYPLSQADREHHLWAEDLLDYFMLSEDPRDAQSAPVPPANANLDRPIDDKGHTALHWAVAMGDIDLAKDLLRRGAKSDVQSKNGETPLMRAVIFTNCFDRQNMDKVAGLLIHTVNMQEWSGSTVFHHIANTTQRKSKYQCARYYMDAILNKMQENLVLEQTEFVLNKQDQAGDTAITIAARHGARKCVRSLIGRNAAVDVQNHNGETADQLIVQLNHRRQERANNRQLSSSPFQPEGHHHNSILGGAVQPPNGIRGSHLTNGLSNGVPLDVYKSDAALTVASQIMPLIFSKAKNLASSIDAEIAEKDAELAEAERVAAARRAEIEALKKQAEDLRVKELEQTSGGAQSDDALAKELVDAETEATQLENQLQALEQKKLLARELRKKDASPDDELMHDSMELEGLLRSKLALVRQIIPLKQQQAALVGQIVQHMSVAGIDDKSSAYKRLITGALNIREEDVEGMLPEIMSELEEWRGLESVGA